MNLIIKAYHYLYYCYYNLVSSKADNREDGASSALSVLDLSIVIAIYLHLNMFFGRQSLIPTVEGFGVFFLGVLLGVLNWRYFVKRKKYLDAVIDSKDVPKYITVSIGILLLILPLVLFIFSGIKMGNYIRSIQ
jgi:hypothetical protein